MLDEIPFWFNGQNFVNKKRNALFACNIETGEVHRLTEPLFSLDSLAMVGETAYFLGEAYEAKPSEHSSLWVLGGCPSVPQSQASHFGRPAVGSRRKAPALRL